MKQTNHNKLYFILAAAFRNVALLCVTGPIMQTFLASIGFSSRMIYIHTSIVQTVNILTISLCSSWADRGNVLRRAAMIELPYALLYLLYIPLCLWKSPSLLSFCTITGICLLQMVFLALWTICEYKLPYYIFTPREYGSVLAIGGGTGGMISLCTGVVITRLADIISYPMLMLSSCVVSMLLMLICVVLYLNLTPIIEVSDTEPGSRQKHGQFDIFREPIFVRMIPANLMRGFGYGLTTILAAIALELGFDPKVSTALVSAQSLAILAGCALVFAAGIINLSPRVLTLAGSLSFCLIPLMLVPNKYLFLAVAAAICLGRAMVDYSVPVLLRVAVPAHLAGPFNAWRILLHNGGVLLATSVAALIPVTWLLGITLVFQLLSGFHFYTSKDLQVDQQFQR